MNTAAHPETSTLAEFAAIAGFRRSYITQLKKDGRLVLDGRRVQVAASLDRIAATRDPSKAGVVARHAAARSDQAQGAGDDAPTAPLAASKPPSAAAAPTDRAGITYQASRAVRERYLALEAKRAYDFAIGKIMDARDVEAVVADAITILRSRLEALQDVLSPLLATISDDAQIRAILTIEVEHALAEASRHFSRLTKRRTSQGSEDARA